MFTQTIVKNYIFSPIFCLVKFCSLYFTFVRCDVFNLFMQLSYFSFLRAYLVRFLWNVVQWKTRRNWTTWRDPRLFSMLSEGLRRVESAKRLQREHRTVKAFIQDSKKVRSHGRRVILKVSNRERTHLTIAMKKKHIYRPAGIFSWIRG